MRQMFCYSQFIGTEMETQRNEVIHSRVLRQEKLELGLQTQVGSGIHILTAMLVFICGVWEVLVFYFVIICHL